jgi:hypothetical protein
LFVAGRGGGEGGRASGRQQQAEKQELHGE